MNFITRKKSHKKERNLLSRIWKQKTEKYHDKAVRVYVAVMADGRRKIAKLFFRVYLKCIHTLGGFFFIIIKCIKIHKMNVYICACLWLCVMCDTVEPKIVSFTKVSCHLSPCDNEFHRRENSTFRDRHFVTIARSVHHLYSVTKKTMWNGCVCF